MSAEQIDLIVIGAGAAAIAAARAARRLDKSVAMVADGPIGGDCTFTGCVPSKTLIAQARAGATYETAHGVVAETVATIAATEDAETLRAESIEVIEGRGEIIDAHTVGVNGARLRCDNLVIATGASPVVPPIDGIGEVEVLTNETVFSLASRPVSLVVLGGGPIGCELAQAFARFGTAVTLFEAEDRLLGHEEPEASASALDALVRSGVTVRLGTRVQRFSRGADHIVVTADDGSTLAVERVLAAVGRRPTTAGLGLERIGLTLGERGEIEVDSKMRSSVDNVYASAMSTVSCRSPTPPTRWVG
ncbi:MAG: FAD-dependent oxidoreductase [Acidobacteria bacterium]|nr:FAD-dependent oxidoreductase [Acidobacteriota bacterium]